MTLHPLDYTLWAASCLAEAILALVILKKDAARRWPFLLSLMLFDICHSALIAHYPPRTHYRQYFYIYWYGQGARSLLSLGLLWDVFRSLPALKYVPKHIGLMLLSAGLTVTIGSVFMTTLHHPHTYPLIAQILMIRECVTVLWMCCAATLLGSISFLGLGWSLQSVNVTAGFLASGVAAMIAASLTSSWPHYGHLFDKLQTCIDIVVFLSWIKSLCHTADAFGSDTALNAVNELYEEQPLV